MQRLGTEWGRDLIAQDIWLRCAGRALEEAERHGRMGLAITDVRFENEAAYIRQAGGTVIHISRAGGRIAESAHVSERGVAFVEGDQKIANDGTLEEFFDQIFYAMAKAAESWLKVISQGKTPILPEWPIRRVPIQLSQEVQNQLLKQLSVPSHLTEAKT
jgi:hypothetical protein